MSWKLTAESLPREARDEGPRLLPPSNRGERELSHVDYLFLSPTSPSAARRRHKPPSRVQAEITWGQPPSAVKLKSRGDSRPRLSGRAPLASLPIFFSQFRKSPMLPSPIP